MRKIRNRRKAQDRWDKLRKYVMYTWGCNTLDDSYNNIREGTCCSSFMVESLHKNGSSVKHRQHNKMDTISFNRKINFPCEKVIHGDSCYSNTTNFLFHRRLLQGRSRRKQPSVVLLNLHQTWKGGYHVRGVNQFWKVRCLEL
ncbi:hypothetical protein CsSME_00027773 [Camellia sinensis var. sinensis]